MAGRLKTGMAGMVNCRGAGGRPASGAIRFIGGFLYLGKGWELLIFGTVPTLN